MDVSVSDKGIYVFGPFRLDPVRRALSRDGMPIKLAARPFDTLLYLVQAEGRLVEKDELMAAVWPGRIVEEGNLTQTISVLRRALQADGESDRFIVTAAGRGYRFAAPLRRETALADPPPLSSAPPGWTADAAPAAEQAAPADRPPRQLRWRWGAALAAILLGAAGGGALLWRRSPQPARALVVLPAAENLTSDPVFGRVLARAMSIDLSQSPFLKVLSDSQIADTLALMARPADTKLTPEIAREACNRNGGDVVVDGTIAALGAQYLLTLTATGCADGKIIGQEKAQAADKDAIIAALDDMASRLRGALGESSASLARFDAPLVHTKTASFDALRAYSDAFYLGTHGNRTDAMALFKHAIELDPKFAMAYANLAALQNSLDQDDQAGESISKAYALVAFANERQKLTITTWYQQMYRRDLIATISAYKLWSEIYPQDAAAWTSLSDVENWVGHYQAAINAGERAVRADPDSETPYVVLARAYRHANDFVHARLVCDKAIAAGAAGDDLHGQLLETAWAMHDETLYQQQLDWSRGKPGEGNITGQAAYIAYSQGRVRDGDALFARAATLNGEEGLLDPAQGARARFLIEFGEPDRARAILDKLTGSSPDSNELFAAASVGDEAALLATLEKQRAKRPADTLQNDVYEAVARAALALRHGRTEDAIQALAPAMPYELRTYDVPYLLGRIYLAAGNGADAAVEFRKILDNPGIDPTMAEYNLAHLGLARALRLQRDLAGSAAQYDAFLAAWRDADTDIPVLLEARAEFAALGGAVGKGVAGK
jgi:DNA-binding winged helix-turn-helix (wHTH) protein/predicted Zn-dependent protease